MPEGLLQDPNNPYDLKVWNPSANAYTKIPNPTGHDFTKDSSAQRSAAYQGFAANFKTSQDAQSAIASTSGYSAAKSLLTHPIDTITGLAGIVPKSIAAGAKTLQDPNTGPWEKVLGELKTNPITSVPTAFIEPSVRNTVQNFKEGNYFSAAAEPISLALSAYGPTKLLSGIKPMRAIANSSVRGAIVKEAAEGADIASLAAKYSKEPEVIQNIVKSERAPLPMDAIRGVYKSADELRIPEQVAAIPGDISNPLQYMMDSREKISAIQDPNLAAKTAIATGARVGLDPTFSLKHFLAPKDPQGLMSILGDTSVHPRKPNISEIGSHVEEALGTRVPQGTRARIVQDIAKGYGIDPKEISDAIGSAAKADRPMVSVNAYPIQQASAAPMRSQIRDAVQKAIGEHIIPGNPDSYMRYLKGIESGSIELPEEVRTMLDQARMGVVDAGGSIGRVTGDTEYFPRQYTKESVQGALQDDEPLSRGLGLKLGSRSTGSMERTLDTAEQAQNAGLESVNPVDALTDNVLGLRRQSLDLQLLNKLDESGLLKDGKITDDAVANQLKSYLQSTGRIPYTGEAGAVKNVTDTIKNVYGTSRQLALGGGPPGTGFNAATMSISGLRGLQGKNPIASLAEMFTPGRQANFVKGLDPKVLEDAGGIIGRPLEFTAHGSVPLSEIPFTEAPGAAIKARLKDLVTGPDGTTTYNPLNWANKILERTLGDPTNKVGAAWRAEDAIPAIDKYVEQGKSLQEAQALAFKDINPTYGGPQTPFPHPIGGKIGMDAANALLTAPQWTVAGYTKWLNPNLAKKLPAAYGSIDAAQRILTANADQPLGQGLYTNPPGKALQFNTGVQDEKNRDVYIDPLGSAFGAPRDLIKGLVAGIQKEPAMGESQLSTIANELGKSLLWNKIAAPTQAVWNFANAAKGNKPSYSRKDSSLDILGQGLYGAYTPAWIRGALEMQSDDKMNGDITGINSMTELPISTYNQPKPKGHHQADDFFSGF